MKYIILKKLFEENTINDIKDILEQFFRMNTSEKIDITDLTLFKKQGYSGSKIYTDGKNIFKYSVKNGYDPIEIVGDELVMDKIYMEILMNVLIKYLDKFVDIKRDEFLKIKNGFLLIKDFKNTEKDAVLVFPKIGYKNCFSLKDVNKSCPITDNEMLQGIKEVYNVLKILYKYLNFAHDDLTSNNIFLLNKDFLIADFSDVVFKIRGVKFRYYSKYIKKISIVKVEGEEVFHKQLFLLYLRSKIYNLQSYSYYKFLEDKIGITKSQVNIINKIIRENKGSKPNSIIDKIIIQLKWK